MSTMDSITTIDPKNESIASLYGQMLSAVTPRPIAFVSTIDKEGNVNISPFSFFNAFSINPPILIFASAKRVRDNTNKDTLENIREVGEAVISTVNFPMVEQMSLTSTEYAKGVNEFVKAGLTQVESDLVKPPRVGESPIAMECKLLQIIEAGPDGGAGNIVIVEVLRIHIQNKYLDETGKIDPTKLDMVGRMGGNWYCRVSGDSLFEIPKPLRTKGIGIDELPDHIKNSDLLTGNQLGRLGNIELLPTNEEIAAYRVQIIVQEEKPSKQLLFEKGIALLEQGKTLEALKMLMI